MSSNAKWEVLHFIYPEIDVWKGTESFTEKTDHGGSVCCGGYHSPGLGHSLIVSIDFLYRIDER